MDRREFQDLLLSQLRLELARRYGKHGEIEKRMARHRGYLSKALCSGARMPIGSIFDAIHAMEIAIPDFLTCALQLTPNPESKLGGLAPVKIKKGPISRLFQVTEQLLARAHENPQREPARILRSPSVETQPIRRKLASIDRLRGRNVARALNESQKYRDARFLRSFIKRLKKDIGRSPERVERVGIAIANHLVPRLICSHQERMAYQCYTLGLVGDALHARGNIPVAAAVVAKALAISNEFGFDDVRGRLLWRTAYLLRDSGHHALALEATSKAFAIFSDHGYMHDISRTHIVRGSVLLQSPDSTENSIHEFQIGLNARRNERLTEQWRFAALLGLGTTYRRLGRFGEANVYIEQALDESRGMGPIYKAKLSWEFGCLQAAQDHLQEAEVSLRLARSTLQSNKAPEALFVSADLARVLLVLGFEEQAQRVARVVAGLQERFPGSEPARRAAITIQQTGMS